MKLPSLTRPERSRPRISLSPLHRGGLRRRSRAFSPGSRPSALLIDQADRGFLERLPRASPRADSEITEGPGGQIGPYTLCSSDRRGGPGKVFVLRAARPRSPQGRAQDHQAGHGHTPCWSHGLESEPPRSWLMDHPNIAHLIDGGRATPSGRPYFVMELVRGATITDFCDQNHYSVAERLEIFVSVCQAIQHAHHKGVIHRDIAVQRDGDLERRHAGGQDYRLRASPRQSKFGSPKTRSSRRWPDGWYPRVLRARSRRR